MVQLNSNKYKDRFGILYKTKLEPRLFRRAPLLALRITNELKIDTPKDTGWASVNWLPTIGFQVLQAVGKRPVRAEGGVGVLLKSSPEQSAGIAALLSAIKTSGIRGYKGAPIYIVNNVPYIVKLDSGSSRQIAGNFVLRAISRAVRKVKA